jgi:hypothetical protein
MLAKKLDVGDQGECLLAGSALGFPGERCTSKTTASPLL